jgi:protein-tyrosine phosphatase
MKNGLMLFCDAFEIRGGEEDGAIGTQLGLSLWPVSSRPLKASIRSLAVDQLSERAFLKTISVLALFSYLLKSDERAAPVSADFPIDRFRSAFTADSFLHPINLPGNFGFCYVLTGTDAPVLSRARCMAFPAAIATRQFSGPRIVKCQPLFDLFPSLSALSLRFPVRPPPLTQTSFIPFSSTIQKFKESYRTTSLPWQKADKLERWKTHLSAITDHLFIASNTVASQTPVLKSKGITHIVNCVSQLVESPEGFACLDIPMNDGGDENVLSHIFATTAFIERAIVGSGKVLVHCIEGVSRSCAVVIGYLILTEKMSYPAAFACVREKRRIASPNPKFIAQLMQLAEIVGASAARTCFFTRQKMIPFEIVDRRGTIVAAPVYAEPDSGGCFVVVNYPNVEALGKRDRGEAGTVRVTATDEVAPEFRRFAAQFAGDICGCLRVEIENESF